MSLLIASFLISLLGIICLIGRKLALVRNGQMEEVKHSHAFVLDIQKIKYLTFRNVRKYEHLTLVAIVRF